jgi:hypothetical protein
MLLLPTGSDVMAARQPGGSSASTLVSFRSSSLMALLSIPFWLMVAQVERLSAVTRSNPA